MKEIKILLRELRNYPDNMFIYPQESSEDSKPGLVVKKHTGEEIGFIELGDEDTVKL